jgi:hypothetical protein
VSSNHQLKLCVWFAAAVTTLVAWKWIPGTCLDRAAFAAVARASANGPPFISGVGSHSKPWTLQTFSSNSNSDQRQAPIIVSLGDDLEGFFQSSPAAPIDLAVIFSNFQRLGAAKAATAAVFAWEKPDPIGLAAFEKSLAGFDSLIMAVPLSRGVVAAHIPPSLRRASIPADRIHGNISSLPRVNRIPIPGVILGGESTIAGFSVLESEPASPLLPLLARWEDRVVVSFSLLTVLQRLDLSLDGIEVRLGEYLKLGPSGPIVPINDSGYIAIPIKPMAAYAEISAEALIDGGDDLFPKQAPDPVILRDDQSASEPATRAFSRGLSSTIAFIASSGGLTEAGEFRRLPEGLEILFLLGIVLMLTTLCGASRFEKSLGITIMLGAVFTGQWVAFGWASTWLPGLPASAAILVAPAAAKFFRLALPDAVRAIAFDSDPRLEAPVEMLPAPEEVARSELIEIAKEPKPRKKRAKKAATKKVAAETSMDTPKPARKKKPPSET